MIFIKNKKEVIREFNKDKYLKALIFFKNKKISLEKTDRFFNNPYQYKKLKKEKEIVAKYLEKYFKNVENVIDLGSGYGSKSIYLSKRKKFKGKKFYLYDISTNGLKLCQSILSTLKNKDLNFYLENFDFYRNKKILNKPKSKSIVFTSYALVYQRKLRDNFMKVILDINHNYVINFEPIYEHIKLDSKLGKEIKKYFIKNDYTLNLYSILKKYEKQKKN